MKIIRRILSFLGWIGVVSFSLIFITVLIVIVGLLRGEGGLSELEKAKTERAVAVIPLTGEIINADKFRNLLDRALEEKSVKAIVVRIDSPGGAVGASEEIYELIKAARAKEPKKPIVCSLANVAASGGLYAAVGCQKIVTNRGTLTGSIGVLLMMPNVTSVLDRFGVGVTVIKSGKFKDAGSPVRPMLPEDQKLFQGIVDTAYEQFVRVVAEARSLDLVKVRTFADGRVIVGEEAVKLGLADEVGGLARAAKVALELAGDTGEPEIIQMKKRSGFSALFGDIDESWVGYLLGGIGHGKLLYRMAY